MGYMKSCDIMECIICIIMQIFKRQLNLTCKEEIIPFFVHDFATNDLSQVSIQKKKRLQKCLSNKKIANQFLNKLHG